MIRPSGGWPRVIIVLCVTLTCTLGVATRARAQAAILVALFGDKVASENFYFSLKGGLNLSDLSGTDETNTRPGANFGLLANIRFNDSWYLVPEFMPLSVKGARDIALHLTGNPGLDDLLQDTTRSNVKLKYIDIPVVLRYHPSPRWYVGIGPQASILLSAEEVFSARVFEDDDLTYREDIKSNLNTWDFGVVFEAGFTLLSARDGRGLTFHLRYALGLTDIVADNASDPIQTSVIQIALSLPFINSAPDSGE